MSRRTRTKIRRQPNQMGLNHHSQYSSTATHFPHSYSIFGSPISIPARLLPLNKDDKINYVFEEGELLNPSCPIYTISSEQLQCARQINLTISGKISQMNNRIITTILFGFTMAFCFLSKLFKNYFYRKKYYTRYAMKQEQYQKLASILKNLQNFQLVVINIQDNQLNKQKVTLLKDAIEEIQKSSLSLSHTDIDLEIVQEDSSSARLKKCRRIVIRNYCYFMNDIDFKKQFGKVTEREDLEIYFIWEDQVTKIQGQYGGSECGLKQRNGQKSKLLNPVLSC